MRRHAVAAALTGFALRLGFVRFFPTTGGDSPAYLELAHNVIDKHAYALMSQGQLLATDARPPGYPLFIAAVELIAGRSDTALFVAQTLIDVATCFLIAALAGSLAPRGARRRVWLAAVWLAALCPFVANYCAVPLTEVLAVSLSAATLLLLVRAWQREESSPGLCDRKGWLLAGVAAGLATLVRAESPLLLFSAGVAIALACARRRQWLRILRTGVWLAAGLLLPLLPWGARNLVTLGRLQLLANRYAEMSGEFTSHGFYAWTNTWLVRFRDVYLVLWKQDVDSIDMNDLPAYAFDSPAERDRVARLLDEYNDAVTITPQIDSGFAEIARERTARHPLRTWLWIPLRRIATLWLTQRVELLPYTGHMDNLEDRWEYDREDLLVTIGLWLVNAVFLALAAVGGWLVFRARWWPGSAASVTPLAERWGMPSALQPQGAMFLAAHLVVRTLFLTHIETPEPRYVLVCFPAVIAFAALWWQRGATAENINPPSPR